MRAVVQRVREATVTVDGDTVASIGPGLTILVAVASGDTNRDAEVLGAKLATLRIFPDEAGKMNRSLCDVGGAALVVSQFTLAADLARGRRPSFTRAAAPELASPILDHLVGTIRSHGVHTETGRFGAMMDVALTNWGPVTFVVDVEDGTIRSSTGG